MEHHGLTENAPITWHTAFRDGIQLTFLPYRHVLNFEFEYPLNTEPLRIDAVIIKKQPDAVIGSPLGAIFRGVNIVEYKSPLDYLSMADYHKVQAYTHLYCALNGPEAVDMTITFVTETYPRKVLKCLKDVYGYKATEKWSGIYHVEGEALGIQIVETKRLKEEDGGQWLRDLRSGLKGEELQEIIKRSKGIPEGSPLAAYIYMVLQANMAGFKELVAMSDATFEEVLEEYGLAAKWEARGLERGREQGLEQGLEQGREEAVKKLQKRGMDPVEIADILELPLNTVFKYLNTN